MKTATKNNSKRRNEMRGEQRHAACRAEFLDPSKRIKQLERKLQRVERKHVQECANRDQTIAELNERIRDLESQLAKARKDSSTSSKPPSSDITNPKKSKKPGRPRKKKIGGQPGHPRHEREPLSEDELDHIVDWRLEACPCCAGKLTDADSHPLRTLQQIELPKQPVEAAEHRTYAQWCDHCQKRFEPALPRELTDAGLIGPRLTALVGWLHGASHMSISNVRRFFRDVLGVRVSRGLIAKVVNKVSASLKDPYDELLNLLIEESVLNVDETGHKDNGRRWWTWCFRALTYTVFKVSPSRGSDVLVEVLGREFNGLLGCDYFSAYHKYMRLNENVLLQFCLAHLIRDVKFLIKHPDPQNQAHGQRLLDIFRKLFHVIHRREEYASEATFRQQLERLRNELCVRAGLQLPDTREAQNIAERFYRNVESYFRFITDPDIAPTNNAAEQAIRFVAIHRRMTQGTRGETGQRWWERMTTVMVTCDQQDRSSFEFLHAAVTAHFASRPAPSLRPTAAAAPS